MPIEFERKFLVDAETLENAINFPRTISEPGKLIIAKEVLKLEQFYMAYDNTRPFVSRCRKSEYEDGHHSLYYHTTKVGSGDKCHEIELLINESNYNEFKEHFKIGETITKTRYTIMNENVGYKSWELDAFHGKYEGLLVLEVEIYDASNELVFPEWIVNPKEVTGDKSYSNAFMAIGR